MNASLLFPLSAGIVIGLLFFGGLWWTVQKGMASSRPALWFMGSLVLRSITALCGFYFVAGGDWKRLAACLCGFIVARLIAIRLPSGARHAP